MALLFNECDVDSDVDETVGRPKVSADVADSAAVTIRFCRFVSFCFRRIRWAFVCGGGRACARVVGFPREKKAVSF